MTDPRTPDIDRREQEQPDYVNEVPVPGGELEAEMLAGGELTEIGAVETNREEDRPNDHVKAVEACRHEEGRRVDAARETEVGVRVLVGLAGGEQDAEDDRQPEAVLQALPVIV